MRLQVPKEQPEGSRGAGKEGLVVLKLFNLLVGEMGPAFLERGVLVPRGDLQNSLRDMPESFWEGCRLVRMDGDPVDPEKLLSLDRLTEHELVRLKVLQAS
jgi:hypothetical protein